MFKNKDPPTKYQKKAERRYLIAILVIVPSFVVIGIMLFIIMLPNVGDKEIQVNLFHALLPLLAAWVGAVVAFYFGTENLQQAQETIQKAVESKGDKSVTMTIKDLLDELPKARDVVTVKLKDSIQEVDKSFSDNDLTNVLVVDDEKRPLGILYKWNFLEKIKLGTPSPPATDELNNHIDKIDSDFVSKKKWKRDEGNMNFATLSLKDKILEAKGKMTERAGDEDSVLSVRGIIKNEEGKVSGIINFSNLTEALKD